MVPCKYKGDQDASFEQVSVVGLVVQNRERFGKLVVKRV